MFAHPPLILPPSTTTYLHFHHLDSPSTTHDNPKSGPSPLLRDVGPTQHTRKADTLHLPLPFSEGCGWLKLEELGREKHKRGPKEWEAHLVHPEDEPQ